MPLLQNAVFWQTLRFPFLRAASDPLFERKRCKTSSVHFLSIVKNFPEKSPTPDPGSTSFSLGEVEPRLTRITILSDIPCAAPRGSNKSCPNLGESEKRMADRREVRFTSRIEAPQGNLVRGMNADQVRVVPRLSAEEVTPAGGINAESGEAVLFRVGGWSCRSSVHDRPLGRRTLIG